MSGHLDNLARAPQHDGFRESPAPEPRTDWSEISRTLTDQMTSHAKDIGHCKDAQFTDDNIIRAINSGQQPDRQSIRDDLKGDLGALYGEDATRMNDKKNSIENGDDAQQAKRDQNVIDFATHLLSGYDDQTGQHVTLNDQQRQDVQNLIVAEKKDQMNSLNDIPNEVRYAQQDETLLQHLERGTATPEEILQFKNNRAEDSRNEAAYMGDEGTAVKALQRVMSDFAPAGNKGPKP